MLAGVTVFIPPDAAEKSASGESNVFVIRMSNPPFNILTKQTRLKLLKDLETAIADESVKAIIIVGSETAFSVGADLTELNMSIGNSEKAKEDAMNAYVEAYKDHNLAMIVYAIDSSPKPVIALISGQCFGGGLEIALGCQYVT